MENEQTITAIEPVAEVATQTVEVQTTAAAATHSVATQTTAAIEPTAAAAIEPVEARLDRIEALLASSGPSNYVPILFIIIACLVVFYLFDMNTFLMVMTTCLFVFGGGV
jgi:hypothetical protein